MEQRKYYFLLLIILFAFFACISNKQVKKEKTRVSGKLKAKLPESESAYFVIEPGEQDLTSTLTDKIILDVPFIKQYPPGSSWSETQNCCQASFLMVYCYFNNITLSPEGIKKIDDWLEQNMDIPKRNYNGTALDFSQVKKLAEQYADLKNCETGFYYTFKDLEQELAKKHPVAIGVNYPSARPDLFIDHCLLIIGIDKDHVWVNDPGRSNGKSVKYTRKQLAEYWKKHYYEVIIFRK